jgi:UDP-3-O-[3-hydroxymyristoyl] glucosamine N-acyltransferase|tara:strand:+ start:3275 stop:4270 length:996 start_codon:yes stop_codon:yes gene_type:complete
LITLKEVADKIDGILIGEESIPILSVDDIASASSESIAFAFLPKYKKAINESRASAFIVTSQNDLGNKAGIVVNNPYLSMIKVLDMFDQRPVPSYEVSELSTIHNSVDKKVNLHLGPFSVISKDVKIGNNVFIGSGVKIGAGSVIGDDCILYDNVVLYDNITVCTNSIIHSGTVIGSDGFGYHTNDSFHHKIPHIKNVIIGENVEIGASCTIDRGSVQDTVIGNYSKLDNQVHLAHNVKIGEGCLIAGGVFIGGSSIIEDFVTIAGKSDIGPHIKIGSKTVLAARSCVLKSLPGSAMYGGNPARPIKEKQKRDALFTRFEILEKKLKKNVI